MDASYGWQLSHYLRFSNYVVCATSKGSVQLEHTHSLIWAFVSRLNKLWLLNYWHNSNRRLHRLVWVYSYQNTTLLEITCSGSFESNPLVLIFCHCLMCLNIKYKGRQENVYTGMTKTVNRARKTSTPTSKHNIQYCTHKISYNRLKIVFW